MHSADCPRWCVGVNVCPGVSRTLQVTLQVATVCFVYSY